MFLALLPLVVAAAAGIGGVTASECKIAKTEDPFDEAKFISRKWYIQQQRPTTFNPVTQNFCVTAEYSILKKKDPAARLGYSFRVFNSAQDIEGNVFTSDDDDQAGPAGGLCAAQSYFSGDGPAEITVGQCSLPPETFGKSNYWVLAYDEKDGYALISGGQPTVPTQSGLCTFAAPFNGLWIFSRSPKRNRKMIKKYRKIAMKRGVDPSDLEDVSHKNCDFGKSSKKKKKRSDKKDKKESKKSKRADKKLRKKKKKRRISKDKKENKKGGH